MEYMHNFWIEIFPFFVGKFEIFFYFMDVVMFITMMRIFIGLPMYALNFKRRI